MSELLKGWLTAEQGLAGKLSAVSGSAPAIRLITREISENGLYRAPDEGADGYSAVTVEVPQGAEPMTPHAFDLTGGYVRNGTWVVGGDTVNYSDVYAVNAGTAYLLMLGSIVGSRFRSMFSEADTSETKTDIIGRQITNLADPAPYTYAVFSAAADGFITITKDNDGTAGLKTYVFSLRELAV